LNQLIYVNEITLSRAVKYQEAIDVIPVKTGIQIVNRLDSRSTNYGNDRQRNSFKSK